MRLRVLFPLLFLLVTGTVQARIDDEYSRFMEAAGNRSVLFRGRQAVQYGNIRYNGHYYWDSPQFRKGVVMFDGRLYDDVYMNVDANSKNLLVRSDIGSLVIELNRDDVEWFDIEGQHFVNLQREKKYEKVEAGFYILLKDGPSPVFERVDKSLQSGTQNYNGKTGIGYEDPQYDDRVLNAFVMDRRFYTVKKGKLKRINAKQARALING